MPVTQDEQVWRLRLQGSGKVAFWLDGTANLFAQNPQQLKPLREDDGQTRLTLHKEMLGPTPNLGIYLPYVLPRSIQFRSARRAQAPGGHLLQFR